LPQKPTKTDNFEEINPIQVKVIEGILAGNSISEVCRTAGCNRDTYYNWLKSDCVFIAEFNRRKRELRDNYRQRLTNLVDKAFRNLEDALDAPGDPATRYRAAIKILENVGLLGIPPETIGSLDPKTIEQEKKAQQVAGQQNQAFQELLGSL
jgi:hypothetical protein